MLIIVDIMGSAYLRAIVGSAVDYFWWCVERTATECVQKTVVMPGIAKTEVSQFYVTISVQ